MTIQNKYYYMRLNEWHHAYLGLIIVLTAYLFDLDTIYHIIGWVIFADDVISHYLQGQFVHKIKSEYPSVKIVDEWVHYTNGGLGYHSLKATEPLPQFLLHTILYKYLKIHQYKWVKKITENLNKIFGK